MNVGKFRGKWNSNELLKGGSSEIARRVAGCRTSAPNGQGFQWFLVVSCPGTNLAYSRSDTSYVRVIVDRKSSGKKRLAAESKKLPTVRGVPDESLTKNLGEGRVEDPNIAKQFSTAGRCAPPCPEAPAYFPAKYTCDKRSASPFDGRVPVDARKYHGARDAEAFKPRRNRTGWLRRR